MCWLLWPFVLILSPLMAFARHRYFLSFLGGVSVGVFSISRGAGGASFSVTVNDFSVSASVLTVDLSPNVFLYLFVLSETFDMTEACGN